MPLRSLLLGVILFFSTTYAIPKPAVRYLTPDVVLKCCDRPGNLYVYCYEGRQKHIVYIWESVQLQISLNADEYERFDGHSFDEVLEKYELHRSSWNFNFHVTRRKNIKLDPFNKTCTGISSKRDYDIKLDRIRIDFTKVAVLLSGLLLFIFAPKLSNNSLFYYLTGISFGTCASLLILIYIVGRLLPRKPLMYTFIAGGWTIGLYIVQMMVENIQTVVMQYKIYVFYYALTTGLISFILCYRFGPVSDPRSINLIKWAMQVAAIILIFFSSDIPEASTAIIIIMLFFYNVPVRSLIFRGKKMMRSWFPGKPRLLTEDEYHQQGVRETEQALKDLRGYCSSPECNQWKTVLKLRNPLRFAQFVEGASHLEDDEVLAFNSMESKYSDEDLMTDDDSSD